MPAEWNSGIPLTNGQLQSHTNKKKSTPGKAVQCNFRTLSSVRLVNSQVWHHQSPQIRISPVFTLDIPQRKNTGSAHLGPLSRSFLHSYICRSAYDKYHTCGFQFRNARGALLLTLLWILTPGFFAGVSVHWDTPIRGLGEPPLKMHNTGFQRSDFDS